DGLTVAMEDAETIQSTERGALLDDVEQLASQGDQPRALVLAVLGPEVDHAGSEVDVPPLQGLHFALPPPREVGERGSIRDVGRQVSADHLEVGRFEEALPRIVLGEKRDVGPVAEALPGLHRDREHALERGQLAVDGRVGRAVSQSGVDVYLDAIGVDVERSPPTERGAQMPDVALGVTDPAPTVHAVVTKER